LAPTETRPVRRYGIALGLTALAILIRWLLDPVVGDDSPLVTVYCVTAIAAALVGLGPALVTLSLGYLVSDWLFMAPRHEIGIDDARGAIRLVSFLVAGGTIIAVGVGMRRGRRRAEAARAALEAESAERRARAEELQSAATRLRLLWESAHVLMTTARPDTMLQQLFAQVAPHLGVDHYLNYVLDDSGAGLRLDSSAGLADADVASLRHLELGHAICGRVAILRRFTAIANVQASADPATEVIRGLGIRAYACSPLVAGDRLLGTLSFGSRTKDAFSEADLEFIQTITQYVSVAFERLRLIEQLRLGDARKDEFLATLAHELRNPLAPLRNASQTLSLLSHAEPEFEAARGLIDRQLQLMTRLVDDLLDVARITRCKVRLRKEPIDLAAVVRSAIESARPAIDEGRHRLTVQMPTEPVRLHADASRLAQVLSNLLTNAAKYGDPAGEIVLRAERLGREVVLSVRDSGIGIAPEQLPFVFDMFSQASPALERAQGGLGIGLALVRGLVELHGGRVEAHSAGLGQGAEFRVRLLLDADAPVVAPEPAQPEAAASEPARRVLVVDDSHDAVDALMLLLKRLGHDVRGVHDGAGAVQAAGDFRPDVVLLDIGLPGMNGYEAARRIRQQPWGRSMVLAALTGWGQEDDKRRSAEAGFDEHLTKPIELSALRRLLAQAGTHRPDASTRPDAAPRADTRH
jgi:signal transduction histidine kinase/FixJ family two-component response regulator